MGGAREACSAGCGRAKRRRDSGKNMVPVSVTAVAAGTIAAKTAFICHSSVRSTRCTTVDSTAVLQHNSSYEWTEGLLRLDFLFEEKGWLLLCINNECLFCACSYWFSFETAPVLFSPPTKSQPRYRVWPRASFRGSELFL